MYNEKFLQKLGLAVLDGVVKHGVGALSEEDLKNAKTAEPTEDDMVKWCTHTIMNGGRTPEGDTIGLRDFLSMEEVKSYMPQVMSNVVTMYKESPRVIQSLFRSITVPNAQSVKFPAFGAINDEAGDVGENSEYPTLGKMDMGGTVTIKTGKVGCKFLMSDEVMSVSSQLQFPLVSMYLDALANALGRLRERKAAGVLFRQGVVAYDNFSDGVRNTTGRGPDAAENGTLAVDDIVKVYDEARAEGFILDTIVMHPLGSSVFRTDDMKRHMTMRNGMPSDASSIFNLPSGRSGFEAFNEQGNLLTINHDPYEILNEQMYAMFEGLPFSMRPIMSPFAPYYKASGNNPACVDITLLDSRYPGVLVNSGEQVTGEWVDPERDIRNFKVSERYAFGRVLKGRGIRIIRGVPIDLDSINFRDRVSYPVSISPDPADLWSNTTDKIYSNG